MRINKTNFCERFFNLDPKIRIYDLDGTIIDSSIGQGMMKMEN